MVFLDGAAPGADEAADCGGGARFARQQDGSFGIEFGSVGQTAFRSRTRHLGGNFRLRTDPLGGVTRIQGRLVLRSRDRLDTPPLCIAIREEDGMALCVALADHYGIRLVEAVVADAGAHDAAVR